MLMIVEHPPFLAQRSYQLRLKFSEIQNSAHGVNEMALVFVDQISAETYHEARNQQVKLFENAPLSNGGSAQLEDDKGGNVATGNGNLFIGYGWDIDVHSAQETLDAFTTAGLPLTQAQHDALVAYKSGNLSRANFATAWADVSYSEAQATDLLNVAFSTFEAALSAELGIHDLPFSSERAAIASQLYNMGINGAPTEMRLLKAIPFSNLGAYQQRTEIWWEIAYNSNGDVSRGLQNRRLAEADTFDLYTNDGAPRDTQEAIHAYQFLALKNENGEEDDRMADYLEARGYTVENAQAVVAGHYMPAFTWLVEQFGGGHDFNDYRQVVVGEANHDSVISQNSEIEFFNTIIFAGNGDDRVVWSPGQDFLNGGSDNNGDAFDMTGVNVSITVSFAAEEFEGTQDALFIATPLESAWQSLFTDFEKILVSEAVLIVPDEETLQWLSQESISFFDTNGGGALDFGLLQSEIEIDFASGEVALGSSDDFVVVVGFMQAMGGQADDTITGDSNANILRGNAGADELRGNGGDDVIFFDAEDTVVDGGEGRDVGVFQGEGALDIDLSAHGLEVLIAGNGADNVTLGGAGPQMVAGGAGDDVIVVEYGLAQGPKVVWGGGGADKIQMQFVYPEDGIYDGNPFQLGVLALDVAGLTEGNFANLSLSDLGLEDIDLTKIDVIVLNPESNDKILNNGLALAPVMPEVDPTPPPEPEPDSHGFVSTIENLVSDVPLETYVEGQSAYLGRWLQIQSVAATTFEQTGGTTEYTGEFLFDWLETPPENSGWQIVDSEYLELAAGSVPDGTALYKITGHNDGYIFELTVYGNIGFGKIETAEFYDFGRFFIAGAKVSDENFLGGSSINVTYNGPNASWWDGGLIS
jgi:Ca2+-binding RTX toxin-like protein